MKGFKDLVDAGTLCANTKLEASPLRSGLDK